MRQSRLAVGRWFEDVFADLRFALRRMRHQPGFTLAAATCLAIGIGANTLIFTIVDAVLLTSLPYPESERLVLVRFTPPGQGDQRLGSNSGSYLFLKQHSHSFERIGALRVTGFSVVRGASGEGERQWVLGGWSAEGLKETLGVEPMIGRWPAVADTELTIALSHRLAQSMFGSIEAALGQNLRMDRNLARVVGVMPPGYRTLNPDLDLWLLQPDTALAGGGTRSPNRVFTTFARLKHGVTIDQAQAEMNIVAPQLGNEYEMNRDWGLKVDSLRDAQVGYLEQPVLILQGAVLLLLLIACANVAGLLLAQATARQRELATRVALGSTRSRTLRQLFAENALLSLAGGALGLALAYAGLRALLVTVLSSSRDLQTIALDWRVLVAAALLSLMTGFVFGAVPALQSSKPDLTASMRSGSRGMTAGVNRVRLRNGFVVAQLASALVLVVGAGLLVRSLMLLNATDPGLDPHHVIAVQVPFPRALYRSTGGATPSGGILVEFDSRFSQMTEQVRARMAITSGVSSAAVAMTPPLGGVPWRMRFTRSGSSAQQQRDGWSAEWYPVGLSYFETLHIPVMRGRTFDARDGEHGRPVAVINQTMARVYWPGEDPVGKSVHVDLLDDMPREIVGVVGDVAQDRYQTTGQPQVYVPGAQLPHRMDMTLSLDVLVTSFLVRTDRDAETIVPTLRQAVASIDQTLPISTVRTIDDYASSQLRELRQYATLLAVFGILSVALAIVGIAGVMAQAVGQRTNEFGVRLALGAQPGTMLVLVLRHAAVLIAIGLGAGIAASLVILPALRSFVWGISETDLVTFTAAVVGLGSVALLACYVPARRAMRVDPVIALRAD